MEEPHDFGPLQMLTVAFDGNAFKGEILPELERLKREGVVRVVDMLAVRKDAAGAYGVLTASDLDWLEATQLGAYIGTLVGFGAGGLEGAQRGAIAGAAELADGHLFDDEDIERLVAIVPPNMTIALLLIEHVWSVNLLHMIEDANGMELRNEWVGPERLFDVGSGAALAQEQEPPTQR